MNNIDELFDELLLEEYGLDELYLIEGLFKKKSKYQDIEPQIEPKAALDECIKSINKHLSNTKYKSLKNGIKINIKLTPKLHDNFIDGRENYLDIATYDMEKIIKKKYDDEISDLFEDAFDLIKNLIDEVNSDICNNGYTLTISDDSEIYGTGGFAIHKGYRKLID